MPFNSIFFGIACSTLIRMPIIIKLTICTHICNLRVKWNNLRSGVFDLRQWYALAISEPFRWKFGWQNDKNETKFTEIAVCCGKCGVCMVLLRRKSEKKREEIAEHDIAGGLPLIAVRTIYTQFASSICRNAPFNF